MNQPSVFVPPELLQALLLQTDGTPLQREKMAAHVCELLFATPIRAAEEEAAPFVAAAVTQASTTDDQDSMRPRLVPVQPPKVIGFGDLQSPDEFLDHLENRVVPAALQGSAKMWFRFTEDFADWSTFATAFRKEFAPVDENKRLKEERRLRTKNLEENLKQFIRKSRTGVGANAPSVPRLLLRTERQLARIKEDHMESSHLLETVQSNKKEQHVTKELGRAKAERIACVNTRGERDLQLAIALVQQAPAGLATPVRPAAPSTPDAHDVVSVIDMPDEA
ncbi:hypothetical protein HPB47_003366 [Ixodes persulcatus]|uniref:Uncharacterized protein n=1 Tax=Ixodes persulcatus TaxID=34615 RepID=A0AC60PIK9_IXOPE|nr:hypothetical protein HPB47_003366 [Ixodes persulcatus]